MKRSILVILVLILGLGLPGSHPGAVAAQRPTGSRPAETPAAWQLFLPLVGQNYDPHLYDNFNDPTYDGAYNPFLWSLSGDSAFQAQQVGGVMVLKNLTPAPAGSANLRLRLPSFRTWRQLQVFQARLKVSSDRSGGWSAVQLYISSGDVAGRGWFTQCYVGGRGSDAQATFGCEVALQDGASYPREFVKLLPVEYDRWYTARIETEPTSALMRFYLDDALVGSVMPSNAGDLLAASNFRAYISVFNGDSDSFSTRTVDDVLITPAQP